VHLYLYLNSNHLFHNRNKVMIYHHYLMIECVMIHLIYFLFVEIFSFFFCLLIILFYHYRKCLSVIRYDVYRLNNVLIIHISNNLIHTIYLYRHPLLYLWSKREPRNIKYVCVLCVNCYVRYFFIFLIDICSYTCLKCFSFFYVFYT
jgi:hypothetical protein